LEISRDHKQVATEAANLSFLLATTWCSELGGRTPEETTTHHQQIAKTIRSDPIRPDKPRSQELETN